MHMADALISPAVGGIMWAASAGVAAYSIKRVQKDMDEKKAPLMGVMGAFVFAAQMINFTIPGTGSSGHIGGGILLAVLLGPYAGFLTMAAILTIQALFFGDGGLLALGCNIINMGFFTCFVAYPLIYKKIIQRGYSQKRIFWASMTAVVLGLQMGAFGVVLETLFSGITELPFNTFILLMQPIHLAIGVIEGLVAAAVVSYVWRERPEIIENAFLGQAIGSISLKKVMTALVVVAMLTGGVLSWFASANPDGLEWSMFKTAGVEELVAGDGIHQVLADIQAKTAFLPDYGFKKTENEPAAPVKEESSTEAWPAVSAGTSVAGLAGGAMTLCLAAVTGIIINRSKSKREKATA